jgi:hypothetical protein
VQELAKARVDAGDVIEFLKRESAKKAEEIVKVKDEMLKKDIASKTKIATLEEDLRRATQELKEEKENARYEIDLRERKIDRLNECKVKEDQMRETVKDLKKQLSDYEAMHRTTIAQFEKTSVEDRERYGHASSCLVIIMCDL